MALVMIPFAWDQIPLSELPALINRAADARHTNARKKRYGLMMGMRVPCMVLAAVFYQTPWLAVTLLVLSIPLPWMAVLIANETNDKLLHIDYPPSFVFTGSLEIP